MSDSYLDHIPSREREKIRKRMRSPEAYEALREKVKGPEDLEREMERNEKMAELRFGLESEPQLKAALKNQVEKDMKEQGIESLLDAPDASTEALKALAEGKFQVAVSSHPQTHEDTVVVMPEGKIAEKLPLKKAFNDRYMHQFAKPV
ncbi:hypothetical protein A3D88_01255 [Candidatus Peribacteria bacterium RIFCSPHIGHO2_02_FULL_52_16]|nr:MAG: hypothetical protein A2706_05980 [Candidatus Peribacteria bacterium RIFCSPHIGHO2_01_FULL_51_35]OGJ61291.1 MAG: hypothetical protein A3D88_01255 [Candidatus Peribacteria bacterium RIFCSPHIGHO2_02_FULL_52_16]